MESLASSEPTKVVAVTYMLETLNQLATLRMIIYYIINVICKAIMAQVDTRNAPAIGMVVSRAFGGGGYLDSDLTIHPFKNFQNAGSNTNP